MAKKQGTCSQCKHSTIIDLANPKALVKCSAKGEEVSPNDNCRRFKHYMIE